MYQFTSTLVLGLVAFCAVRYAGSSPSNSGNPLKDNSPDCVCYVTAGDSAAYYTYHRFHDFRNLNTTADEYLLPPPIINSNQDSGNEETSSAFLSSDAMKADWDIQSWGKPATSDAPIRMQNSPLNLYIQNYGGKDETNTALVLRTTRLENFQSTGEVENLQKNLWHASLRIRARVTGSAGACAGLFTYFDDTNESDIEILTRDPTSDIRYTNQPSVNKKGDSIDQASLEENVNANWRDWNTHRIDWLPDATTWYINGKKVARNTYSVPRKPSRMILNMWSDGGVWTDKMDVGGTAILEVAWVQMLFNTSGSARGPNSRRSDRVEKRKGKGCAVVCKVDNTQEVGYPEVVINKTGRSAASNLEVPGSPSYVAPLALCIFLFVITGFI